jgi:hypothetical protein
MRKGVREIGKTLEENWKGGGLRESGKCVERK